MVGRGYRRRQITHRRDNAASSEGLGVLPRAQDINELPPRCAITFTGAFAESGGDRDPTSRLHDVNPEQDRLGHAATGSTFHAPPML